MCSSDLVSRIEMRVVGETIQTERVTIAKLQGFESAHRGVADDESLPLPRRRSQAEQMADEHTVGARVRDEGESVAWFFNVPDRQLVLDAIDTALGEKLVGPTMDALGELADRFASFETTPSF